MKKAAKINRTKPVQSRNRLLAKLYRWDEFLEKAGDLEEAYYLILDEVGHTRARVWLTLQIIKIIPIIAMNCICWRYIMLKNSIKIAIRHLQRHRVYSFLNIMGLTVGLTLAMLIILYVQSEFSYDSWHRDYKRIYRVVQWQPSSSGGYISATAQGPLAPALKSEYPEVESAARLRLVHNILVARENNSHLERNICFASPEIFDIFSLKIVKGTQLLEDPASMIISEKIAFKYFGDKDPVGQILHVGSSGGSMQIVGVMEDMPNNSHFIIDLIIPFSVYAAMRSNDLVDWYPNWFCYTYCKLKSGVDPEKFEQRLSALVRKYESEKEQEMKFMLQPLSKIHLFSHVGHEIGVNGDIKFVVILSSIGFLVLLISCINYTNLSTARSLERLKEIGVRKVAGAQRTQLVKQLLGESIVITVIAFAFGLVLVTVLQPFLNLIVERNLQLSDLLNVSYLFWFLGILVGTSLVAGAYPAYFISSCKPVLTLQRRQSGHSGRNPLRNALVIFQFSISILLIICTVIITGQWKFIHSMDVGYDTEQIVVVRLLDGGARRNAGSIKTELLQHLNIVMASSSSALPNRITSWDGLNWPGRGDASTIVCNYVEVDYDFLELYNIGIEEGRPFSQEYLSDQKGAFMMNEVAVREIGWADPLTRNITHLNRFDAEVVGVVENFHFQSLHDPVDALYLFLSPSTTTHGYLSLKIKGERIGETISFIEDKMKQFSPSYPFQYEFFDEIYNRAYRLERKLKDVLIIFSSLAIFLACLGLFGLAAYTAARKTKEIGIRKVLGASISCITYELSAHFLKWVLIANIIAWPIAYYAMDSWLQNFSYRIQIQLWMFIFASLIVAMIALVTVIYQSVKAATANPVTSLRYE